MTSHELRTLLGLPEQGGPGFVALGIAEDSRRINPGDIFVAVAGDRADGHAFAAAAAASGGVAILGNRADVSTLEGLPYLYAENPRRAAALIAHQLSGDPTARLAVIGITGTNGKSSTALLTQSIFREAGCPTSNYGTLGYEIGGRMHHADHTTPFGDELARLFKQSFDAGDTHVVMEVSSHALDQERVAGIHFRGAAFTNLTQDHLDYHATMDAYRDAKLKLFQRLSGDDAFAVINNVDPAAPHFQAASAVRTITFGEGGTIQAKDILLGMGKTRFTLSTPEESREVSINILGLHNVQNALCAAAIGYGMKIDIDVIAAGLEKVARVPGRFDAVDCGQDFFVIVDYAHTEDGLKNVLEAARVLCKGRIITVFGCGGDRDRGKRPKMGKTAGTLSDYCVLTSDNPRSEDPHRILLDVEVGLQRAGKNKDEDYVVIESREEAIRNAIALAKKGDLVMIAGKGHEDYQILADKTIHFDDREVAASALEARN
jgi:UDP-N-acetylmuramoyl-L-alanyl-D-glutamate--2,6-diaminopimelate ligase